MVRQAVRQAHGPERSRRTHHLTTLSQVEGQISITEIQNPKQMAFDLLQYSISARSGYGNYLFLSPIQTLAFSLEK
jgi:hypothetical protein